MWKSKAASAWYSYARAYPLLENHMRIAKLIITAFILVLFTGALPAVAQTDWEGAKTFHVGGEGGWDYLTVDPDTHRLYVTRTHPTLGLDRDSPKTIAHIAAQHHSPLIAP